LSDSPVQTRPGWVWTYDTVTGGCRPASPAETAIESNFYSLQTAAGEHDDTIEQWLATIEGKASEIYDQLIDGEIPTGEARVDIAIFFATLLLRTPAMIRDGARMQGEIIAKTARLMAAHDDKLQPDLREFIRDSSNYRIAVDQRAGLLFLNSTEQVAKIFFKMGWAVFDVGRLSLISCDNPVVRITPLESHHALYGDGGFLNKRVWTNVPLSPRRCLNFFWGSDKPGIRQIEREEAMLLNRLRAIHSDRYLYANRRDEGLRRLGLKYRGLRPRLGTSPDDDDPKVEVKRRLQPR
jgi:hypothetical protein